MDAGYYAPVVELSIKYKQALMYGECARVDIFYLKTDAAKIIFEYEIHKMDEIGTTLPHNASLIATGRSVQVFIDKEYNLLWTNPPFYEEWKRENGLKSDTI
jgi:acyl-CoA thioester hydrolase